MAKIILYEAKTTTGRRFVAPCYGDTSALNVFTDAATQFGEQLDPSSLRRIDEKPKPATLAAQPFPYTGE